MVDASAAVLGLLDDGDARRTLSTESVVVPHLADSEIAQALRSLTMRGAISEEDAGAALEVWQRMAVRRSSVAGLLARIWELRHALTAYDATYVALSEGYGCALVTADVRLGTAPGPRCPITIVRA